MADLSYDDAARAAQSGTRDIFGLLQHIQGQQEQMGHLQQRSIAHIEALQQQLIMCNRQLQSVTERVDQLTRQSMASPGIDQRIGPLQQDIAELRSRFAAVERFATDVSDYLQGTTSVT